MMSLSDITEVCPGNVDRDLMRAVCELLCEVWPKPGRTPESRLAAILEEFESYDGPQAQRPRALVLAEEGRAIAHAAVVPREIDLAGRREVVAGLARVCTAPDCRGRGLGELLVRAAWEPVDRGDFVASLFQTTPKVRPFYERLGAATVGNRVVNSLGADPVANPFWDGVVMRYPAVAEWPTGTIDLLGPGY